MHSFVLQFVVYRSRSSFETGMKPTRIRFQQPRNLEPGVFSQEQLQGYSELNKWKEQREKPCITVIS